jgi:isoquinoline 1-oxidoreductase beta subunit
VSDTSSRETWQPSRREFLALASAAGVLIGFRYNLAEATRPKSLPPFDAWIEIRPQGQVGLWVAKAEMGQGVFTALPMLLAEELDVDWSQVRVQQCPIDPARYDHLTVGSNSIASLWQPLRVAAARARVSLTRAAALRWRVSQDACHTESGTVVGPDRQRLAYYELLSDARRLLPGIGDDVKLKPLEAFRVIGRPHKRLDSPSKVDGSAGYGIDVRVPGLLRAVIARCPMPGGRLRSFDAAAAKSVAGVSAVFPVDPQGRDAFTRGGVAVVARDSWAALEGRRRLKLEWDESASGECSTRNIFEGLVRNVSKAGPSISERGDTSSVSDGARDVVEATYELPFLAHATMEPMNATVAVRSDTVEAWLPTQNAEDARAAIARVLGRPRDSVVIHQTLLGGGFGRRDATDFVVEAAQVAAAVGRPVQVLWSREDDLRFDRYRPAAAHSLRASLDARGYPRAWLDRMSSVSIAAFLEPAETARPADTEVGGALQLPYDVPGFRMEYTPLACPIPVGWWTSVEDSINAFAVESFIDELAGRVGLDPLEYRLKLLSRPRRIPQRDGSYIETERLRRVLVAAARISDWSNPPLAGRGRGLACHSCRGSYVAVVAELSLQARRVVVHRLSAAVDCGTVVNPLGVEAQISGGLQFGTSAALYQAISIERGQVKESNFDSYGLLRLADSPPTEVELLPSGASPSGVGEIAVPPVAPALANALAKLTGRRVRKLPLQSQLS